MTIRRFTEFNTNLMLCRSKVEADEECWQVLNKGVFNSLWRHLIKALISIAPSLHSSMSFAHSELLNRLAPENMGKLAFCLRALNERKCIFFRTSSFYRLKLLLSSKTVF